MVQQPQLADVTGRLDPADLDVLAVPASSTHRKCTLLQDPHRVGILALPHEDRASSYELLLGCLYELLQDGLWRSGKQIELLQERGADPKRSHLVGRGAVEPQELGNAKQPDDREPDTEHSERPSNADMGHQFTCDKREQDGTAEPRTRPRTSRGRSRCSEVKAKTSTTTIPAPAITCSGRAGATDPTNTEIHNGTHSTTMLTMMIAVTRADAARLLASTAARTPPNALEARRML
jgi:hypothetical protein